MNKINSDSNPNSEDNNSEKQINSADARLILFNDDVNAFPYVIECLTDILKYDDQQAEQLTLLTHYKGSTTIKAGSVDALLKLSATLKEKGLKSAVVQNDQK